MAQPRYPAASLSHTDLEQVGHILDPIPIPLVKPDAASTGPFHQYTIESPVPNPPPLALMKAHQPRFGYAADALTRKHRTKHLAFGRGHLFFDFIVYERVNDTVFRAPHPSRAQRVVVKRIDKTVASIQGRLETIYRDVSVMTRIGDDVHVLRHLDFLEDERYLYVVTPQGEETLKDKIDWYSGNNLPADETRTIFVKLLKILQYLADNDINHHDLSPDNLLCLSDGKILLFDMEFAIQMPTVNGHRTLMRPQGNGGTPAFMCPEVYINQVPFDGCAMDLFAVAHILFNLITNRFLYRLPVAADDSYNFFVLARGLDLHLNERLVDILQGVDDNTHEALRTAVESLDHLGDAARELLQNMLQDSPRDRPSLAQVMDSPYSQGAD